MSFNLRIVSRTWIAVLLAAAGFLGWSHLRRAERIVHVSNLTAPPPAFDASFASGYADGVRHLIVPEHNAESFQWIAQTQAMLAAGTWQVREVGYDNAPFGRSVRTASLHRWWLGLLAHLDQALSGRPAGVAIERAALWSGPVVHGLLLISVTLFVAWRIGSFSAAFVAAGLALLFPLAGAFVPGQPDDLVLALTCVVWSVLPLVVAVWREQGAETGDTRGATRSRCFLFSGFAGGGGLWVNPSVQVPVLLGIALGALIDSAMTRARSADTAALPPPWPWRAWGLGGALTCLVASVVDGVPGPTGLGTLETVHPLYGVAWLGLAELLARATGWLARTRRWTRSDFGWVGLAIVALAAIPAGLWLQHGNGFLPEDPLANRLTALSGALAAPSTAEWLLRDGFSATFAATLLPLVLLVPAIGWLARPGASRRSHRALALSLGPVVVGLGLASMQLRWWSILDALLLVLLAILAGLTAASAPRLARIGWIAGATLVLGFSLPFLVPRHGTGPDEALTKSETESLIERDLAYWLTARTGAGQATVLAPPHLAASLAFYGGQRALSTPYRENMDGFAAAVRIAGATLPDEAHALVRRRGVTHILVPSWDAFLDEYARLGASQVDQSFMSLLHRWLPPRWLRPVPYQMPVIAGMEDRSVAVFEVVEVQDDATALSHLAEYFVETASLDNAAKVADALAHLFPEDGRALIARAQVEKARGNAAGFARCLEALEPQLTSGATDDLAWEGRVQLAIVLAEARRLDEARTVLQRCLGEVEDLPLRALTTGTLYRLQLLARAVGLTIADARLRDLALQLIPAEMRAQLLAVPFNAARK